jgi:phage portal protein BeeE
MKMFGFNISVSKSVAPGVVKAGAGPTTVDPVWRDLFEGTPAGTSLSNAYQQVVWVYRAVTVLAEQVANVPFLFSRGQRGREDLITSGPLLDFYARPHPQINSFQYWELRVLWLMLRGECMRIPIYEDTLGNIGTDCGARSAECGVRSPAAAAQVTGSAGAGAASPMQAGGGNGGPEGTGEPGKLNMAEALTMLRTLRDLFRELGPTAAPAAVKQPVTWEEVAAQARDLAQTMRQTVRPEETRLPRRRLKQVLIVDPSLFEHVVEGGELVAWRYRGLGKQAPLEAQVFLPEEVWFEKLPNPYDFWRGMPPLYVADVAAKTDFAAAVFMRGYLENNADNGLIVRTSDPLDEMQRAQILASLRGRKNRAGVADRPLLLWSSAEVVRPELSSADLQFLENRKYSRSEICAAFGVPEEIVGCTESAKYDVMQGARQNFIEHRVAPLCARLEAEEQQVVKSIDRKACGWFDVESLPSMQAARRARLAAAKTGFDMGIPFNELNKVFDLGFKPLPWGDAGYLASGLNKVEGKGT